MMSIEAPNINMPELSCCFNRRSYTLTIGSSEVSCVGMLVLSNVLQRISYTVTRASSEALHIVMPALFFLSKQEILNCNQRI